MRRVATGIVVALLFAGCGGGSEDPAMTESRSNEQNEGDHGEHDHSQVSPTVAGAREISVAASSFRFDPASIEVEAGEQVTVALTSTDILHDFTVDELDAHVAAEPGRVEKGGLTAKKAGTYTYYCSVAGHRQQGMEGRLVVR